MIRIIGLDDRGYVIKSSTAYHFRPIKKSLFRKGDRVNASFIPGPGGGHLLVENDGHMEKWARSTLPMGQKRRSK